MWRRMLRWLACLFLVGALALPASAQGPAPDKEKVERGPPAFQYALSLVGILLVLVILCMPTRKR